MNKRQDEGCIESCGNSHNIETRITGQNQELQANLDHKTTYYIFPPYKRVRVTLKTSDWSWSCTSADFQSHQRTIKGRIKARNGTEKEPSITSWSGSAICLCYKGNMNAFMITFKKQTDSHLNFLNPQHSFKWLNQLPVQLPCTQGCILWTKPFTVIRAL